MLRFSNIVKLTAISFFISGCATLPIISQHKSSEVAKAWENQTATLEILDSFVKGGTIYIKYQAYLKDTEDKKIFLAKAECALEPQPYLDLSNRMDIPIEIIDKAQWDKETKDLETLKSFSGQQWKQYRDLLASKITPTEEYKGNLIKNGNEELFFYKDKSEGLKIVDLNKKPGDVSVYKIYSPREFSEIMHDVLIEFLGADHVADKKILFVTKNEFNNGNSILYIDMERNLSLSLKVYPNAKNTQHDNLLNKTWRTADHLILESHVFGIAKRPVSSLFNLVVKSKNTAYETIKSYTPDLFEQKKIDRYYDGPPMDLASFEKKLNSLTKEKPYKGSMHFLVGGEEFFHRLIGALSEAKDSIEIRIFIFDRDDFAVKIADILKRKSNEGVDVKILLDGIGQIMGEGKTPETLPAGFVQPSSIVTYLKKGSRVKVRIRPNAWFKADHTKTIMIDNKICFTGGMNIGREYRYDWHDLMVELKGPILKKIRREFKLAWAHSGPLGDLGYLLKKIFHGKERVNGEGYDIRLLFTKANDPQIYKAQLLAIREAKKYIYISNAYFSDATILDELISARKRGVDVRVILPIHGNHEIMNANNVVKANIMFKNGIKVYFYPGMSHIKAAIYDGWLCTGSANFDKLSLIDNLELNVATSKKETVDFFKNVLFEKDFQKAKLMTEPLESGWGKWLGNILANHL